MNIKSAQFIKGIVGADRLLSDGKPQIAFIGRSNVGKSSTISSLVKQKNLVKTSSFPGHTQQINMFLINNSFYLMDLPGYGYTKVSGITHDQIQNLIDWYLFKSPHTPKKVILIIDAYVGPTENDLKMLYSLEEHKKNTIIIANKVDKIKKSNYFKQMKKIENAFENHTVIPYSAEKGIGIEKLNKEISI